MRIDVIESLADLENVRSQWDRVYLADPHAQYFLSFTYLYSYLRRRGRWFILALREKDQGSPYVAFFPLRIVTNHDPKTGLFRDDIVMAGSRAADYAGVISEPGYEARAIEGFALFLKSQNWTSIQLENFTGPAERRDALLRALAAPELIVKDVSRIDQDNINPAVCPVVTLPDSWDEYLETKMSGQTRQKLRRFLRQIETNDEFRITVATQETAGRDLDILFSLWREKWAESKGERTDPIVACAREILMDASEQGDLFLPILWHRERPLGAIANFLDRQRKAVLFYVTGRDKIWKTPSPGLVLHGFAIRQAIADGYRTYDFLRGNEPYKYAFGAEDRPVHRYVLHTATGRNLRGLLNIRSISHVYQCGTKHYSKGDKALAERAFEQVIAAYPEHYGARFSLAQLLFERGRAAEAEAACKEIVGKVSDPFPVLLRMGDAQIALKRFGDAVETFAAAIELRPNSGEALYKRGVSLVAGQRKEEAITAFWLLEAISADDPTFLQYRRKAADALAMLVPLQVAAELPLPSIHPSGFPLAGILTRKGQITQGKNRDAKLASSTSSGASKAGPPPPNAAFERPRSRRQAGVRTKH
jgi:tetratricopeptide (TPR) repeat protein